MDTSRRWFLAAGLGTAVGVAGCLGDQGSSPNDNPTPVTTRTTTKSQQTTTQQTTEEPTTTPVESSALAEESAFIVDEVTWFATAYESSVDSYIGLCEQAITTIEQVRRSSTLTDTQLEKVRTAVLRASENFDAELESHFDVYGPNPEPHLDAISTFAERGDIDRAHQELTALLDHMEDVSSGLFVQKRLARDPIQDTLWRALTDVADGSVLFGFKLHSAGFDGWCYPTKPEQFNKYTWGAVNADYRDVFGPTTVTDGRTHDLSVTVNQVPKQLQWEKNYFTHLPVFVQRYDSTTAAEAAYEKLTDTAVTIESQVEFGPATWDQGYFYYDGDIQYAYFLQVGTVIYGVAPSKTPWDERDAAEEALLKASWLWDSKTEEKT